MDFRELAAAVTNELAQVFQKMDDSSVKPFTDALTRVHERGGRVFAHACGREGISLRPFVMRLAHMGFAAHWAFDDTATGCARGDIYVTSVGSGSIDNSLYYHAERAKDAGARVALLTAAPDSAFAAFADIVVYIPAAAWRL